MCMCIKRHGSLANHGLSCWPLILIAVLHFDLLKKLDACMNRSVTMSSINTEVIAH